MSLQITSAYDCVSKSRAAGLGEGNRLPTQVMPLVETEKRSQAAPPLFVDM